MILNTLWNTYYPTFASNWFIHTISPARYRTLHWGALMLSHGPATLSPHSHDSEPQLLFSTTILQCVVALSIIAALTDHTHTISHPQSPVPNDMLPNNLVTVWLRQITTTKVRNHFTWFQSSKLLLCLVLHRDPIRKLARVLFPHLWQKPQRSRGAQRWSAPRSWSFSSFSVSQGLAFVIWKLVLPVFETYD